MRPKRVSLRRPARLPASARRVVLPCVRCARYRAPQRSMDDIRGASAVGGASSPLQPLGPICLCAPAGSSPKATSLIHLELKLPQGRPDALEMAFRDRIVSWASPGEPPGFGDDIDELLARRADLSTFLVHFTRDSDLPAREALLSILRSHALEARTAYGLMQGPSSDNEELAATQRCVCLSEMPLEHVWMMCRNIARRAFQFAPYGLAFSKEWGRSNGANPVWYVDITPGHEWLSNPLQELVDIALNEARAASAGEGSHAQRQPVHRSQIAKIAPFIEKMGSGRAKAGHFYRRDFSWEREWRRVGTLAFSWNDVVAAFAPSSDHDALRADLLLESSSNGELPPPLLDPTWGLERMVSSLRALAS